MFFDYFYGWWRVKIFKKNLFDVINQVCKSTFFHKLFFSFYRLSLSNILCTIYSVSYRAKMHTWPHNQWWTVVNWKVTTKSLSQLKNYTDSLNNAYELSRSISFSYELKIKLYFLTTVILYMTCCCWSKFTICLERRPITSMCNELSVLVIDVNGVNLLSLNPRSEIIGGTSVKLPSLKAVIDLHVTKSYKNAK